MPIIFNFRDTRTRDERLRREAEEQAFRDQQALQGSTLDALTQMAGLTPQMGPPDITGQLQQLNETAQQSGMSREQLNALSGLFARPETNQFAQQMASSIFAPQQPKPSGVLEQFLQARDVYGLIPPDMTLAEFKRLGAQNINIDSGGVKLPAGYMPKDPNDITKGITPIPGGPQDDSAAEAAGKIQMMRTARNQIPLIESLMFNEDGTPNMQNIATGAVNAPRTAGREMSAAMEVGIQAITRMETGAAMQKEEVQNTRKRFEPSILDKPSTIRLKWEMFQDFLNGNLKLIDPSGRFDDARFNAELKSRQGKQKPKPNNVINFEDLP